MSQFILSVAIGIVGGLLAFLQGRYAHRVSESRALEKMTFEGLTGAVGGLVAAVLLHMFSSLETATETSFVLLSGIAAARTLEAFRERLTETLKKRLDSLEQEPRHEGGNNA